jgi:hypothetical protein
VHYFLRQISCRDAGEEECTSRYQQFYRRRDLQQGGHGDIFDDDRWNPSIIVRCAHQFCASRSAIGALPPHEKILLTYTSRIMPKTALTNKAAVEICSLLNMMRFAAVIEEIRKLSHDAPALFELRCRRLAQFLRQ